MTMTTENNYSWLRQNKEPENSYKWFTYYRDMEGTRRLKKVIEDMKTKEPYLESYPSYQKIRQASSIWKWKERCKDYDNYLQIQLIESHKKTLIKYEEESINIDVTLYEALNNEIQRIIKNKDIDPLKKLKALKEAQELNKGLLSNIEHIANTEIPEVKYIDVEKTRDNDIIQTLIDVTNGFINPEELEEVTEGYSTNDVEEALVKRVNKLKYENERYGLNNLVEPDIIKYNNKTYKL